jgi:hypothetical protein
VVMKIFSPVQQLPPRMAPIAERRSEVQDVQGTRISIPSTRAIRVSPRTSNQNFRIRMHRRRTTVAAARKRFIILRSAASNTLTTTD